MVKIQVYRKATHTDQYLNFSSHHPLNHTLGAILTLYDFCDNNVTAEADAAKEIDHVNHAFGACSYLSWSFKSEGPMRVENQLEEQQERQ